MEAALVFDKWGVPIYWHTPPDRTMSSLPDSRGLWEVLWDNRADLGGVAHTHPWSGFSGPSQTDVTTFAAVEAGLGQRLIWPVVTFTHINYLVWIGPGKHDYATMTGRRFRIHRVNIDKLIEISGGSNGGQPASSAGAGGSAERDLQRPER
jgi:hypothetical protein